MFALDTLQDLRGVGRIISEKYRSSKTDRLSLSEFNMMKQLIVSEAGKIIENGLEHEKMIEAVKLLGEMRTSDALPFIEEAYYHAISGPKDPFGTLAISALASAFRTESYVGHKFLRREFKRQREGDIKDALKIFGAGKNNLSWRCWNAFVKNQDAAAYHAVQASSFDGNMMYIDAVGELVEAVDRYPYDGALWYKLGEVEAKIAHNKLPPCQDILKNDRRFAYVGVSLVSLFSQARNDLFVAEQLSPFDPEMLLDIGYAFFRIHDNFEAVACYDNAFLLKPELWVEAALHYRRGLARECLKEKVSAYYDFQDASKIYAAHPEIPKVDMGRSSLEECLHRTKPSEDHK